MTQEPQAQDVRRLFLQAVLSRGMMSEKMAKNLWHACANAVQGQHIAYIGTKRVDTDLDNFV